MAVTAAQVKELREKKLVQESWTLNALLLKLTEIWKRQQNFFVKKGLQKQLKKS